MVHRGFQMLTIYLLDDLDKFEAKRKELGINLREEHMRDLISRINAVSHRSFIESPELEEHIKIFMFDKDSLVDCGVVDKIEAEGDPIDWLEKIVPYLVDLGLIRKNKYYLSSEETSTLLTKLHEIREKIGEGEESEVNGERYGLRVKITEGKWSIFWDALEYCVKTCSRFSLFLYILLLETFFEKS